jgi:hypothetical protein
MVTNPGHAPAPSRRPQRAMQIALALVVLVSGILIDAGATVALLRRRFARVQKMARPTAVASAVASRMRREYDLTDPQTRSVEQILRRRLDEAVDARRQFFTHVGAARDGFLSDMKDLLPPAKYDLLEHRFKTRERPFRWFFELPQPPQDSPPDVSLTGRQE